MSADQPTPIFKNKRYYSLKKYMHALFDLFIKYDPFLKKKKKKVQSTAL